MNNVRSIALLAALAAMPIHAAEPTAPPAQTECAPPSPGATLTLADTIQQAFCRNPQTREWWANVGSQEAQVKQAQAAYWPQLSAQYQASRDWTQTDAYSTRGTPHSANLSASYLLYDFGGRDAAARLAQAQLQAARSTRDDLFNSLAYNVAQAYLDTLQAQEVLKGAGISEASALESLKAAEAQLAVGATIPATRLQAQTTYSQAKLTRIKDEGNLVTSRAKLANLMGLSPDTTFQLASWHVESGTQQSAPVGDLIKTALASRQDLRSAQAQVKAAEANVDSARAQGLPNLSLSASAGRQTGGTTTNFNSQSIGLTLSAPLFTGFKDTYRIRAAQADLDNKRATEAALENQVQLDVWNAYQGFQTNLDALQSAHDAVISGTANEQLQLGRFKAGVGTLLDVLTAQASAATARQQEAGAEHDYLLSKFALAQALGRLNAGPLPSIGE